MQLRPHVLDELCQRLREQLLLPRAERPPKLAEYGGRGSLLSWLRIVAMRAAVDTLRAETVGGELHDTRLSAPDDPPDVQLLRARYRPHFVRGLRVAFGRLSAQQREVLRLSLVDRSTLEQIGRRFGVTKSTVHRWIDDAQHDLAREVRRFFQDEVGVSERDLGSAARLLLSRLEISLPSLLRTP
jgi:RNA polymerase sigma-70 factor (ECF subfamily)